MRVTPFHDDFSIDIGALRENATKLADTCDAVVSLGHNGGIVSLVPGERKLVERTAVEEVHGRKPVLVGVGFVFLKHVN